MTNDQTLAILRRLWTEMAGIYGHRWASSYGASPEDDSGRLTAAGQSWAKHLAELEPKMIRTGVDACGASSDPWPPTLPQFRASCFAMSSRQSVIDDLTHGRAETQMARMVYRSLDRHELRQAGAVQARWIIGNAYDLIAERVLRGEIALDAEPEVRLAAPDANAPERELTAAERRKRIQALMQASGITPSEPDPDVGYVALDGSMSDVLGQIQAELGRPA